MQIASGSLYGIVDPSRLAHRHNAVDFTGGIIDGGASIIQLRDKQGTARETCELGRRLREVCVHHDALFIVNDRLDIALATGADGVHLGPHDVPVEAARSIVDDEFIIGGSAGTPDVASGLERQGADYLGVGAVYEARSSKSDASPPRGPEAISAVVAAVDIPVVGIGGIDETNASEVVEHGAAGVAVISALSDTDDPTAAARRLILSLRRPVAPDRRAER